jgi:outer membrane protein
VVSGATKIRGNQAAVDSNREAMNADRIGLDAGTRTEFELLQAQTNYYDTLRAYYQSRYDYLGNLLTLKQLAGRLTEADLAAVDALLVSGAAAPSAVSGGLSADTAASGQQK